MSNILDPGYALTLRPMRYPQFFEMYKNAIKNTWTVEEVDFTGDLTDLRTKMSPAERHLIQRLVAFFATGDTIVANNLVLNLYQHINAPEARMYLSRQLYEEALHIQFYLNLLDNYIPEPEARNKAFSAIENIPSIRTKGEFCFKWIDAVQDLRRCETREDRRQFLLNLICFACCIEGLFFYAAFAYVYFLRSKGLLHGLAAGTNWVFRDESCMPLDSTEILTEKGFVSLRTVVEEGKAGQGIKVAQYDEQGFITFVEPRGYIKKDFKGSLVQCRTDKSVSLTVTPDHDNITRSKTTGEIRKTKALDMSLSSTSELPCAGRGLGECTYLSDIERFAVVYQADGTAQKVGDGSRGGTVGHRFSFSKTGKIRRFEQLLANLGWEFTVRNVAASGNRAARQEFYVKVPQAVSEQMDKDFAWIDVSKIHVNWVKEFIEELSYWDSYLGHGDRSCVQYINTNKAASDKVQAVAALGGFSTTRYEKADDRSDSFNTIYSLFIKQRDYAGLHKAELTEMPFEGEVGCINVPTGMIVVRQEGKVHVTGNCHMAFAFEVIRTVREEEPDLFDDDLKASVYEMLAEAIECEFQFSQDVLEGGVSGMSPMMMRQYLEYCADQRFTQLGMEKRYFVKNPFDFMDLQDVQEVTNFFERRVSAYQVGVEGEVSFDEAF